MPKTHEDIIIENEERLHAAMLASLDKELRILLDPGIVYVNESGQQTKGFENIPLKQKNYKIYSIEILSRDITVFNSVAITTTLEIRSGHNDGYDFFSRICLTRVWKFDGRKWALINVTTVSC